MACDDGALLAFFVVIGVFEVLVDVVVAVDFVVESEHLHLHFLLVVEVAMIIMVVVVVVFGDGGGGGYVSKLQSLYDYAMITVQYPPRELLVRRAHYRHSQSMMFVISA